MLLAPAFLFGLLAIGLPLWLHRFARRTEVRRPFASVMLLETSEVHRSRRHTLRYLLLLALRIALLAALALAFAEPILRSRLPLLAERTSTLHIVVLDTSLSMQQGERWKNAVEQARKLIDGMDSGDRAMLVAADHRVRIVQDPVFAGSADRLRAALATLEPGLSRLDYGMLMTTAESWIATRERPAVLHLITDLQQTAGPLRFADLEPPPGVQLALVDVGDTAANLAITSASLATDDADALEVHFTGSLVAGDARSVILDIDGQERARRSLVEADMGPRGMRFEDLAPGAGNYRVALRLEPQDPLPQDDQFFLTVRRSEPRVLLLTQNASADDAAYLAAAVGALTRPRLAVERGTPEQLGQRALADYAAVIVSDAGILSGDAAASVRRYLDNGGAVMMTLGARAAGLRTMPVSGHELQSGLLGGRARGNSADRVAAVEESHPILRDAQGWRSVRFFRHVPVVAQPDDTVLLRFEKGAPLLIEKHMGGGRLLLLTSPLAREWNDLAISPLFVRFIGEAARYLTGMDAATSEATVGSIVTAGLPGSGGAQVFDPRGRRALTLGDISSTTRLVPDQTGFYEVRGGGRVDWLAVNVDARESDLGRMPDEGVQRWLALRAPATTGTDSPDTAGNTQAPPIPVWLWVLLAVAGLAFLEPLVANYHLHVRREGSS